MKWWIDDAFAVHKDMHRHTSGMLSLGHDDIYSSFHKQKLNTKSSTKAKLVGVNSMLPQVLWTHFFLHTQGFKVNNNIVYHNNQSTTRLENNGKASSGKRTRHIDIRYFFVTNHIESGELDVKYCPTENYLQISTQSPCKENCYKFSKA